ncbi:MAG: threonine--tRNA ligase, partial [Candidatus Micrarchaeota archaeon]|nr:threonine--tRNA ligase [Candidatus Micrarchaeota archaeon]
MRALLLHAKHIEVIPREKALEAADPDPSPLKMENALVVYVAFERGDQQEYLEMLLQDTLEHLQRIKADHVLLYPYVHLTSQPESPVRSRTLLNKLYELFQQKVPTFKAPFGWYKEFDIHVYGHPLSELSREYRKGKEIISQSLKQEETLKSEFYIFDGELHKIEEFDFSQYPNLKKLADYETKKSRAYESEPVHIELMKRLELVDYEPASDSGNLRYYPKGRLIKKIIEDSVTHYCIKSGAHEVETPIMYDFAHPSLEKYLNRFPARQYTINSDQRMFFLRFAACFGQFLIAHDVYLSYKQLPFKLYELTRYSFRREQSGELMGLKRLRAFTMPDMHTFVRDFDQAREEFLKQLHTSKEIMEEYELYSHIEIAFRAQKDFFYEHLEWYKELQRIVGKPFLIELFDQRYAYFITKFEFNFIDSKDKA